MGDRRGIRSGSFFRTIEPLQAVTLHPVDGQVATDGVQFSSVATVGTTGVQVFNKIFDLGVDLDPKELELSLTQEFDNLSAAAVGTISYYWQVRNRYIATQGAWGAVSPTISKGVPTSGVSGDPVADTLSGFFPVASLPSLKGNLQGEGIEIRLMAVGLAAASFTGRVKNTSYVTLIASVIPGT